MPGYRGHLVGGLITYIGLMYLLQPIPPTPLSPFWWLLLTLAGALFPDIDTKSKGQFWFSWLMIIIMILLLMHQHYAAAATIGIASMVPMLSKHRGIFHNLWFVIAVSGIATFMINQCLKPHIYLCSYDMVFFIAGAWSHIILDLGIRKAFKRSLIIS